jgi:ankyrin repeat protein
MAPQYCEATQWHLRMAPSELTLNPPACVGLSLQDGWTPLHRAAENGRKEVVRQLLGAGAAVDAATKVGPCHQQWMNGGSWLGHSCQCKDHAVGGQGLGRAHACPIWEQLGLLGVAVGSWRLQVKRWWHEGHAEECLHGRHALSMAGGLNAESEFPQMG